MALPKIPVGKSVLQKESALTEYVCPTTTQSIGVTDTPASSDAITSQIVRLFATVPVYVAFGENPTTATPDFPLGASAEYFYYIPESYKVGFVRFGSVSGTIYISSVLTA
ncbi:hypothetical protein M0R19_04630 [Candidatus Pacearchaeota archaeon]|jgi:hypothetical protein|nr:hypothetical protein [Candidatus Pacearchaeota archaeon]